MGDMFLITVKLNVNIELNSHVVSVPDILENKTILLLNFQIELKN